jgi:hypothetical protein
VKSFVIAFTVDRKIIFIDDIGDPDFFEYTLTPTYYLWLIVGIGISTLIITIGVVIIIMVVQIFCQRRVLRKHEIKNKEMEEMLLDIHENAGESSNQDNKFVIKFEDLKFLNKLSEGAFGVVFKV